jgi:Fe-S-cluster-containing hydrogenase component 2
MSDALEGTGMRTTVCHVDVNRCTGCGTCVAVCPHGAVSLRGGVASIDEALCRGCGECVEACPSGAVTLEARLPAALESSGSRVPTPGADEYVAVPVSRQDRIVVPGATSLLARVSRALAPAALSLAAAVGQAWLNRMVERGAAPVSASACAPRGGRPRRWRGRGRGRC